MRRMLSLLLLTLSGSSVATCVIDAITVPDTPLSYMVLKPGTQEAKVTVRVTCARAQDRYGLMLAGNVQAGPGGWEAELTPRWGGGDPLRVWLTGAAEVFGPGVTFGGDWNGSEGPRTYTHTIGLRAWAGQWVAGGDYVSTLRVSVRDF